MKLEGTLMRHKKRIEKMHAADKLYGTTTMGARGQVVIPARARRDLRLKPGDQLIVVGKFGRALGLMKASELGDFIKTIMGHMAGSPLERMAKTHFDTLFGRLQKHKK